MAIGRKAIPSFPPREVLQDYIRGRLAKAGTKQIQRERERERERESVCERKGDVRGSEPTQSCSDHGRKFTRAYVSMVLDSTYN